MAKAKKTETVTIAPFVVPIVSLDMPKHHGEWLTLPSPHIKVCDKLMGQLRAMTILHEAIHGIAELYGVTMSEQSTRNFEMALTNFLRDNLQLIEDLQT